MCFQTLGSRVSIKTKKKLNEHVPCGHVLQWYRSHYAKTIMFCFQFSFCENNYEECNAMHLGVVTINMYHSKYNTCLVFSCFKSRNLI
jgi:hypothetical protein